MSSKKGYVDTSIPLINSLLKLKIFIILSNWTFQGMLYADKTERLFRLLLDCLMTIILYAIINQLILGGYLALIFAFLIAHTFNWIFNGQFFVLGRYIGIKPDKHNDFIKFIKEFKFRIEQNKSIQLVVVYGSMARKELKESSDLDVRIVRKKGIINAFKSCFFAFSERKKAFFNRFPLDLYVVDSTNHLSKMRLDEVPIIIYDPDNLMKYITTNEVAYA
ncbi:MAG: nucleotidyltransferase domain-containing protein [Candidatus Methanoperedens sp.]